MRRRAKKDKRFTTPAYLPGSYGTRRTNTRGERWIEGIDPVRSKPSKMAAETKVSGF